MLRFVIFLQTHHLRHNVKRTMASSGKIAVVRFEEKEDYLNLSFKYALPALPERQFNFRRSCSEEVGKVLARIATNINNAIEKKSRKKKRKKEDQPENAPEDTDSNPLQVSLMYQDEKWHEDVKNSDAWKEGAVLQVGNSSYIVSVNAPTVVNIQLPKCMMAGFPVYPQIELQHSTLHESIFTWFKTSRKGDSSENISDLDKVKDGSFVWLPAGQGFFYSLGSSDIGRRLMVKCQPLKGDRKGLEAEAKSGLAVEAGPGPCPFEARHAFTRELTSHGRIRCVSYNILADQYADSDYTRTVLFPYCPPYALEIDYRKQLILKELLGYNSDLVCLQEVDRKVYFNDLCPVLGTSGMESIFNEKGGQVVEGLACFFRSSKFRCIDSQSIILGEALPKAEYLADLYAKICENESLKSRILARTTAVQAVLLESKEIPGRYLLVANTHLYFHPDADHIRLLQATCCIRYVEYLLENYSSQMQSKPAVVFFGDFNSCPEFGVYQLMTLGIVAEDSMDWRSNEAEAVQGLSVSTALRLSSACGTPEYTNFTVEFSGCLDYIFYDLNNFSIEEVVPFPSHEEVTRNTALPNVCFPSDHLSLAAVLKWNE